VRLRRRIRVEDDPPPQTIEELNDEYREWIAEYLLSAADIVRFYVGENVAWSPSELALLDRAFALWLEGWLETPESERVDPNPFIYVFGIAFGQALVDGLGLEWKTLRDADGKEIVVHGDPHDFVVFPASLVAKRVASRETMFLEPMYEEVARTLKDVREERSQS
jgi:hypothetical protein